MFPAGPISADTAHVLCPAHWVGGGEGRRGRGARLCTAGGPEAGHVVGGGGGEGGGHRPEGGHGVCVRLDLRLDLDGTLRIPE